MFSKKGKIMKTKLLPQTRLFMIQCLLTMILAFSFNNAHAQYQSDWEQGFNDYQIVNGIGIEETQSYVGQYLSQGDHIQLMQKLKLKQAIRQGKKVLSITVNAQASSYNSKLILKVNGQKIDAQPVSASSYGTVFQVPALLQHDSLAIKVKGSAYVESVSATIKSMHSGGHGQGGINQNGVVKAIVHKVTQGTKVLKVKQLIKSQNRIKLQGLKVKKVIMKASSRRGRGQATLLINGSPVGYSQTVPMGQTRLVFNLGSWSQNIIGQDIRSIQIQVKGNITTKMVGLKLAQNGHGRHNQSISINVNQAFYGSQRLSLASLLPYGSQVNQNKQIEAITIVARGRGMINVAGASRAQGSIQVHGPTTQSIRVSGSTSLRNLKLRVRATGNKIVIEQVRIKFKRGHY